jgi:HK97 family phage major capsid protein
MRLTKNIEEARTLLAHAVDELEKQDAKIQALEDDAPQEDVDFQRGLFEKFAENVEKRREAVERLIAIERARTTIPPSEDEPAPDDEGGGDNGKRTRISGIKEPLTYRADNNDQVSYFADLYAAKKGDWLARERLERHGREVIASGRQVEKRDVSTADPGAGVFVPPMYLDEMWAELPREGRPTADALPKIPLPDVGMTLTVPRITTGTTTAIQATEASAASETDIDGTLLSVGVRTIAGQNDVSIQALERTLPGMDFLIFQDLRADYDEQLDTQVLQGTGSSGQHLGLDAVSGINTVTYTDGTPTAAELVPKIYNAIERVASVRFRRADTIIVHPRRAAWLASNLSSTFPLFQLGTLMQAAGSQQAGFVDNFAGLRVIIDANISTEIGASTDEDQIFVIRAADLFLAEGPLRLRVFDDVLSGTLQVRLQVVAYSAFVSGRQPGAISRIRGTGLKAPTF